MPIEQSGSITPGHVAVFAAPNVVKDGGARPGAQRVIASLVADFNDINDQPLVIPDEINAFQLTAMVVAAATISLTTAVGGFYPEASKTGSPIVAAGQTYTTLTTPYLLMQPTLTAFALSAYFTRTLLPDWSVYLSLTTAQGSAALANVYLIGMDLTL